MGSASRWARALPGLLAGVLITIVLARLVPADVNVRFADPIAFSAAALFLVGVALLACYVPARRATQVAPMEALRCE